MAMAVAYLYRPITIQAGGNQSTVRGPYLRVGQAVEAAGLRLYEEDIVEPGLNALVPFNGKIEIRQSVNVWIWEDGWVQQVRAPENTPAGIFQQAGITLNPEDRVFWNGQPANLDAALSAGRPVVLQIERAKLIWLNTNGSEQEFTARGPTAAHALWQAGVRPAPGDRISTAPGTPLQTGLAMAYLPARPLTLHAGGAEIKIATAAATVGEALADAGIAPQSFDYAHPPENQPVPPDGIIRLIRVREDVLLSETLTPYESTLAADPELELDNRRIIQTGQYGVQVTRERVRYEDGQEVSRFVDSDWTASTAIAETIGYGTKAVVQTADMPEGTIEYWRKVHVYATSYSPCRLGTGDGRCGYTTASGARLTKGIVAVPRAWFRDMNGQRVYIPGYGFGVIADTGGMRGLHIDLGFDEENFEEGAIVGWVDLYFLTPIPAAIPWTLQ